jgi:hypothetical protein
MLFAMPIAPKKGGMEGLGGVIVAMTPPDLIYFRERNVF